MIFITQENFYNIYMNSKLPLTKARNDKYSVRKVARFISYSRTEIRNYVSAADSPQDIKIVIC